MLSPLVTIHQFKGYMTQTFIIAKLKIKQGDYMLQQHKSLLKQDEQKYVLPTLVLFY